MGKMVVQDRCRQFEPVSHSFFLFVCALLFVFALHCLDAKKDKEMKLKSSLMAQELKIKQQAYEADDQIESLVDELNKLKARKASDIEIAVKQEKLLKLQSDNNLKTMEKEYLEQTQEIQLLKKKNSDLGLKHGNSSLFLLEEEEEENPVVTDKDSGMDDGQKRGNTTTATNAATATNGGLFLLEENHDASSLWSPIFTDEDSGADDGQRRVNGKRSNKKKGRKRKKKKGSAAKTKPPSNSAVRSNSSTPSSTHKSTGSRVGGDSTTKKPARKRRMTDILLEISADGKKGLTPAGSVHALHPPTVHAKNNIRALDQAISDIQVQVQQAKQEGEKGAKVCSKKEEEVDAVVQVPQTDEKEGEKGATRWVRSNKEEGVGVDGEKDVEAGEEEVAETELLLIGEEEKVRFLQKSGALIESNNDLRNGECCCVVS